MQALSLYWFAELNLDGENLTRFTWNLVQSLTSLVLISKSNSKYPKNG